MDRRRFLKLSAITTVAVTGQQRIPNYLRLSSVKDVAPTEGVISDSAVKALDLNIRYVTGIIKPPKHGKSVDFWIPLPQSDHEQEITKMSVDSPVAFHINEGSRYGNKMVYIGQARLKAGDKITIAYRLRRKTAGTIIDRNEDLNKILVLTEREKWNEDIIRFIDDVVGREDDPLEVGRKVYYSLVDKLTYDREIPGCGQGISAWIFEQRRGKCDDFHALFRTMMTYKGIPVRWEQGISLPYPSVISKSGEFEGDCFGAHCWVRFYSGNGKWVPVDASEANKRKDLRDYFFGTLSPNRFKVSTGRDIILEPPQGGDPLNTFPYTYGEYEGIPLIYGHHYRNIIRYELLNVEV